MKRIMIVGCPRSGTTLLQGLIASHEEITSFAETHFFTLGIKNPLNSKFYYVAPKSKALLYQFLETTDISAKVKKNIIRRIPNFPFVPGLGVKKWITYYFSVLDEIALDREKQIWVEKTPDHLKRLEIIQTFIPNNKVIHIIRDGGDTIASLFSGTQQWDKNISLDDCIQFWNVAIKKSYKRINNSSDIFIYYKKLAENPIKEINKLLKLLNLNTQDDIIDRYNKTLPSVIKKNEYWKRKNYQKIEFQSAFVETFNEGQRNYIQKNIDKRLFNKLMDKIA